MLWIQTLWIQTVDFLNTWAFWIAAGSIAMFAISLIATPYIIALIPVDYFSHHHRHRLNRDHRHPVIKIFLVTAKNILGSIMLLAGIIMLFAPGPGLLCMLFGLMMMNYPGKYRLECRIIKRPLILHTVNAMRKKHSQPALLPPDGL